MKIHLFLLLSVLLFFAAESHGQKPLASPSQAQAAPEAFIPLDFPRRAAVRDLQYQIDQAQIQIEQLKERQIDWTAQISDIATDFGRVKQLDLTAYELDAVNVGLKKKATIVVQPTANPETKPPAKKKPAK